MRNKIIRIVILILGAGILIFCFITFSYFLANYEYEKLIELKPKSRKEVESILFFYSAKPINIEESMWGRGTILNESDYCYQYNISLIMPIDIIYDKNGFVKNIFSSYE